MTPKRDGGHCRARRPALFRRPPPDSSPPRRFRPDFNTLFPPPASGTPKTGPERISVPPGQPFAISPQTAESPGSFHCRGFRSRSQRLQARGLRAGAMSKGKHRQLTHLLFVRPLARPDWRKTRAKRGSPGACSHAFLIAPPRALLNRLGPLFSCEPTLFFYLRAASACVRFFTSGAGAESVIAPPRDAGKPKASGARRLP